MLTTPYLTVVQASRYASCHPETIRRAIRSKALKSVRIGRVWRVRAAWIDEWLLSDVKSGEPAAVGPMATATKRVN